MNRISKLGLVLAGIYILISIGFFTYALNCHEEFCGFVAIVVIMPWNFLAERLFFFPNNLDGTAGFFIFVLLNAIILYFIGTLIGHFLKKKNA